jgi:HAD superfamily hydrolase (TIGR01509 family)
VVKCIIFDCDGTLVDSEYLTNGVIAEMAGELGIDITGEEATKMFGGKTLDAVIYGMKELSQIDIPEDWLPRLIQKVSDAYKTDLLPMDGIKELLENVSVPVCVASNGEPRHVNGSLKLTGLNRYFGENIFTASMVGAPKPAPDLFLYAANKMNFEPKECVVIEDSVPGVTGPFGQISKFMASLNCAQKMN